MENNSSVYIDKTRNEVTVFYRDKNNKKRRIDINLLTEEVNDVDATIANIV